MADLPPPSTASEEVWKRAERLEITIEDAERLQEGDVKVVYHPSSGKPYEIISQRAYQEKVKKPQQPELNREPWRDIFDNKDNFELAELILNAALNDNLINRLFKIIGHIHDRTSQLIYTSSCKLNEAWNLASSLDTPVSCLLHHFTKQ